MKYSLFFKFLFIGVFLTVFINSCSVSENSTTNKKLDFYANDKDQIVFQKCTNLNWESKKVEASFEDNLEKFDRLDTVSPNGIPLGYALSENNLKQGITLKLKIKDVKNREEISEITIESYELKKGKNQFTIGYIDNKPYIIY